jgi:hypothetical protein
LVFNGRLARVFVLFPGVLVAAVRVPLLLAWGVKGLVLLFWHPVSAKPARIAPASPSTGFLIILISPETVVSIPRLRPARGLFPALVAGRAAVVKPPESGAGSSEPVLQSQEQFHRPDPCCNLGC